MVSVSFRPIDYLVKEPMNKYVALSPHIDDLAFSLGAAILSNCFSSMLVINIFSVSQSTIDDRNWDVTKITRVRKQEDREFFNLTKARVESIYLDRLDAPLRLKIRDEEVFDVALTKYDYKEVKYLRVISETLMQRNGILLVPLGVGRHIDHVLVHRVACGLTRKGWATVFYEDLPYACRMPLVDIKRIVNKTATSVGQDLKPCLLGSQCCGSTKARALGIYRSQVDQATINSILKYGQQLGGGTIAERVWCGSSVFKQLKKAAGGRNKA